MRNFEETKSIMVLLILANYPAAFSSLSCAAKKAKSFTSQVAHRAGAYLRFL